MRVIVQTVYDADVTVEGEIIGAIDRGYLLYVGLDHDDTLNEVEKVASKLSKLRINSDENGKININGIDSGAQILSISQFTLYADCKKGNRPSFTACMNPEQANELYEQFNDKLRDLGFEVETGKFGADMKVRSTNDGPMTFILDTQHL